jgi:hypothetical protein
VEDNIGSVGKAEPFKPPYVPLNTLNGLLNRLGKGPIPPRIDKGYLDNYSGSTQGILLAALRSLGLIKTDGTVEPLLREMATDPEKRKTILADLLFKFYPEQIKLAQENATSQQLEESFRKWKLQGSTLRKAIVFYLEAVKFSGAPNSPHFKPPRQTAVTGRKVRRKQTTPRGAGAAAPPTIRTTDEEGERIVVAVGDVGKITVITALRWTSLTADQRTAVFELVDKAKELGTEVKLEEPSDDLPDEDSEEEDEGEVDE